MIKSLIQRVPLLRWPAHKLAAALSRIGFQDSAAYWERRYRRGGSSGAGSHDRLARFKAEVLNQFVAEHGVQSVIEFGCGDGHQLSLAEYPRYLGLDVAPTAIERCQNRFVDDPSKEFSLYKSSSFSDSNPNHRADLALSIDVIYHLVEDAVFESYMRHLFGSANRFVIIYSSNYDEQQQMAHVRRRKFTDFVETRIDGWTLHQHIANRYPYDAIQPDETSRAEFFVYTKLT